MRSRRNSRTIATRWLSTFTSTTFAAFTRRLALPLRWQLGFPDRIMRMADIVAVIDVTSPERTRPLQETGTGPNFKLRHYRIATHSKYESSERLSRLPR